MTNKPHCKAKQSCVPEEAHRELLKDGRLRCTCCYCGRVWIEEAGE